MWYGISASYWGWSIAPVYASIQRPVSCLSRPAEWSNPSFHDSTTFPFSTASLNPPAPALSAFSSSSAPVEPSGAHGSALRSAAAKPTTNGKFPSVISAPRLGSPFSFFFLKRPLHLLACSRAPCRRQGERRRCRAALRINASRLKRDQQEGGTEAKGGVEVIVGSR